MFNRCTLIGELVGSIRKGGNNSSRFTLLTTDSHGEQKHSVLCVGNLAEKISNYRETDKLFVEGKLQSTETDGVRASVVFAHTIMKL